MTVDIFEYHSMLLFVIAAFSCRGRDQWLHLRQRNGWQSATFYV